MPDKRQESTPKPKPATGETGVVPRPRGRPKVTSDSDQAASILSAAKQLFLAVGYGQTTMSDVAACCHISKRTLYRHFPAKTDLLAGVIDQHRHSMLALPGDYSGMSITEALEQIFLVDISDDAHAERSAFLNLMFGEAARYPEIHDLIRSHGIDRAQALLAEWLETENRTGRIAIDDADSVARMLMDTLFGGARDHPTDAPETPNNRKPHLRRCIRIIVQGIGGPGGPEKRYLEQLAS